MATAETWSDKATGTVALAITVLVILNEWQGGAVFGHMAAVLSAVLIALLAVEVRWSRRVFVLVGALLIAADWATDGGWLGSVDNALRKAAFIAAFFTALTSLRHAADTSPVIRTSGLFLARQPPGRRYGALTLGGHLFGLVLNYGAIALLGSLALASVGEEPDTEIRDHRVRRMLLAIQRGFVATLTWSPLAFAMAISTSLVPGADWSQAAPLCFATGAMLAGLGWTLDTVFKPRLSGPTPPAQTVTGSWASLLPLLGLLVILVTAVVGLSESTGVRAVGVVMVVVPVLSASWIAAQTPAGERIRQTAARGRNYVLRDLSRYRGEMIILMMAGFIGTLGADLLVPLVQASGLDLSRLPGWLILVSMVWIIPVTGQFGMNPILSVSLIAPILPAPAAMGVSPAEVIVAITGGWALSGASSPFTATTLMVGAIGGVSASWVGVRWNGIFTLLGAVLVSIWVAVLTLT
jgi:hypothetical protein